MTLPPFAWPATLAGVLALTAGFELCVPQASPAAAAPVQIRQAAAPPPEAVVAAGAESWAAAILQRPLFRPDRRPLAPDAAVSAAPPPLPRLSAIVITAAGATAIFAGDDGTAIPVAAGGMIDGDRIATIGPGAVVIIDSGATKILKPQFAPGAEQADAAPAAAPVPGHNRFDNY